MINLSQISNIIDWFNSVFDVLKVWLQLYFLRKPAYISGVGTDFCVVI